MEEQNTQYQQPQQQIQTAVPNATAALILGILSIPTCCCCFGILGAVLGIIGLVLGNKAIKMHLADPGMYTEGSLSNAKAGRICAIIGIILSILVAATYCILFITGELSELHHLQEQLLEELYNEQYY